ATPSGRGSPASSSARRRACRGARTGRPRPGPSSPPSCPPLRHGVAPLAPFPLPPGGGGGREGAGVGLLDALDDAGRRAILQQREDLHDAAQLLDDRRLGQPLAGVVAALDE